VLDELLRTSESFREFWDARDVDAVESPQPVLIDHPEYGELEFIGQGLPLSSHGTNYAYFLVPTAETSERDGFRRLLAKSSEELRHPVA
jgi:MmyB-like transcription regulator ligand binding domain